MSASPDLALLGLAGTTGIETRSACPRCSGRHNLRLGYLADVWYFLCTSCDREFRVAFSVEDVEDQRGRI